MVRRRSADPLEGMSDDAEVMEDDASRVYAMGETTLIDPRAAPDPTGTPGLPVAAVTGPARTPPAPCSVPLAPVQSWLVPATGP